MVLLEALSPNGTSCGVPMTFSESFTKPSIMTKRAISTKNMTIMNTMRLPLDLDQPTFADQPPLALHPTYVVRRALGTLVPYGAPCGTCPSLHDSAACV